MRMRSQSVSDNRDGKKDGKKDGNWGPTRDMTVKILSAVYVGGAYSLILAALIQAIVIVSWLRHG
ncbi:MAG: hypothetical protein HQL60_02215 [Magnetococcales bacterium]|nr:hypothetical protein [Magnetococcales bacterium]